MKLNDDQPISNSGPNKFRPSYFLSQAGAWGLEGSELRSPLNFAHVDTGPTFIWTSRLGQGDIGAEKERPVSWTLGICQAGAQLLSASCCFPCWWNEGNPLNGCFPLTFTAR